MSCYVCSTGLMMDLARAISSGQFDEFMEATEKELFKDKKPAVIFKDLYALNVRSVNDRYHENSDVNTSETYKEVNSGSFEQTAQNLACLWYQCTSLNDMSDPLLQALENIKKRIPENRVSGDWDW